VKPHECETCGKRFAQKFELVVHKQKHTGEKPYSCDVCHKKFSSKVNLNNHKRNHSREFPFQCSVCSDGFNTKLQLEKHVTGHTGRGVLPYTCQLCQKGYNIQLNLTKHMLKAHGVTESLETVQEQKEAEQNHIEASFSSDTEREEVSNTRSVFVRRTNDLMPSLSPQPQKTETVDNAFSASSTLQTLQQPVYLDATQHGHIFHASHMTNYASTINLSNANITAVDEIAEEEQIIVSEPMSQDENQYEYITDIGSMGQDASAEIPRESKVFQLLLQPKQDPQANVLQDVNSNSASPLQLNIITGDSFVSENRTELSGGNRSLSEEGGKRKYFVIDRVDDGNANAAKKPRYQ